MTQEMRTVRPTVLIVTVLSVTFSNSNYLAELKCYFLFHPSIHPFSYLCPFRCSRGPRAYPPEGERWSIPWTDQQAFARLFVICNLTDYLFLTRLYC